MAIFVRFSNGNLAHQMTSKRETARTKVVVSSSVDKMVKEFWDISVGVEMARYLRLALKQRKMTPLWSPLAADPFDLDDRSFIHRTISFILRTKTLIRFTNFE